MPHKTVKRIMQKYMAGFALLGGLAVYDGFVRIPGESSDMMLADRLINRRMTIRFLHPILDYLGAFPPYHCFRALIDIHEEKV